MSSHGEGAAEGDPPPTKVDGAELPPTSLDGAVQGPPPTSLDGAHAPPPTSLDGIGAGDGDGGTLVNLPPPLREDYETIRDMASGGEGDLLLVRHRPSGEQRVVKIYRVDRRRDERALEILSAADPAHVVVIHDSGQHSGRWWEVMEHCEHGSLIDLISREGPRLGTERVEEILAEVSSALIHLHELQIPHRDLKPGNILVRSFEPLDLVLADFGLARFLEMSKEMHSRLVISAAYASPQATASGAISPAMDWWSLGIIVAELAQGRNPFQLDSGEWLSNQVVMDWISSRPIDLSGIEDERLANLCRGLTLRDDRRGHRWGAAEVGAWLAGEDPEVAAQAGAAPAATRAAASPFPFKDPTTGRTRPFTNPAELASALAHGWEGACTLLSGAASHRAEQRALRNFLRSLDLTGAEQILAEQDDVEERLVRLLIELDPSIAPTFRGYSIDREGLLALSQSEGEAPRSALAAIFSERILLDYSRSAGHADLAELDAAWHEELAAFEATIEAARAGQGEEIFSDPRERRAAIIAARAQILAALLDEDTHRQVLERAAEAAVDESPNRQGWFAALAGGAGDG